MGLTDKQLNKAKRELWIEELKNSKIAIAVVLFLVLIYALFIHKISEKYLKRNTLKGVLEGVHQIQTEEGSRYAMLGVRLENGKIISVSAPSDILYKIDSKVIVAEKVKESGRISYSFQSYENSQPK